nr:SpoIIE family protein phosphatase [Kibdelosporangium phytohabitans]
MAAVDWAASPLGPPAGWSQSLRTAVGILLSSRFPMWLAWGPELTFFCNAAYRRDTLGRKYPWALGRSAREVWAEIWDDIGPRIETVLTTGQATWDEELLLFLQRSGYPEETYHTFSYSPLRDDAGIVVGMLCVVSEDTGKVIGERRMATLRDLGSDTSVVRTQQETIAFSCDQLARNQRDLPFTLTYLFQDDGSAHLAGTTGVPAGHPAAAGMVSDEDPGTVWPMRGLVEGKSVVVPLDKASAARLPSGGWPDPPTQALLVPLRQYGFLVAGLNQYRPLDEGYRGFVELVAGHIAAGIASARSFQAQQRRAEELAELDRAKTTFFSNISHEFRTPLTLIMGPLDELRDRLAQQDRRVLDELDLIKRNGLRLGKLVNSLLDFSRIEAGRMRAAYEPVDLAAVTADLASVFRSAFDRAGLAFHVDCGRLPEPVYIDRGMWEKVVLNLLSNALKFTFDGSVEVSLRAGDGEAVVTVADTGVGVPPEEIPRLFQRFHRIENTRSRSNEGSGIGLALVHELVGLHGGTTTADSVVGKGTRFTIRLPFGSAHLPADALSPAADAPATSMTADPYVQEALRWLPGEQNVNDLGINVTPAPASATAVLVADDNADMREYLARLLTGAGYDVHTVTDGVDALQAARTQAPDLVISDVMMPRLDGLALVSELRADRRTEAVPVLLLSARAGQEASIEGLHAGADDYLVKPFSAAELLARVRANVELSRLRTHHARWRTALVDSLQEAFFVCDDEGAVIETNSAFTDILGYGPEGLPYRQPHPWWPDENTDPEAHRQVTDVFAGLSQRKQASLTIPVTHRDGHRLWISATFNPVQDPDSGHAVTVGTFRDVTAEHYAIQRDTALAALHMRMSAAVSLPDALAAALEQLRSLWRAERVVAVVFGERNRPTVTSTDADRSWSDLDDEHRTFLTALRERPALSTASGALGTGITLDHPDGSMVLWFAPDGRRPFTDQDTVLLSLLGGHLAQGLARARQIDQQRETALELQRAILGPSTLPDGFAVRYEPAARPLSVGGDWYDAVHLPDGSIGIVVGDCVGRGLKAAAVMGQLRSACRALLLQHPSPARTLMALDDFAAGIPGARCTTVFCGILNPETGVLTYSSAGHPPPILAHADGVTALLDQASSTPLAVRSGKPRPAAECVMPPRTTLLMYTDGLVERRRQPLTEGIALAAEAVVAGHDSALDDVATQLMTKLAPAGGYDDDVALLLCRHPAPLDITVPAEPARLAPIRRELRAWSQRCGLSGEVAQALLVVVGEASANAIDHGYHDMPSAMVRVRAEALSDRLHVTVTDTGRWKTPQPEANPHRGRGIGLMRALTREFTINSSPDGTIVDMHMGIA